MFFSRDSSNDSVAVVDGARNAAPSLRQGSLDPHLLSDFGCKGRTKIPQWPLREPQARGFDAPRQARDANNSGRQVDALASVLFTSLDVKQRGFVSAADVSREVQSLAAMNPRFHEAARGLLTRLAPCHGRQLSHDDLVAAVGGGRLSQDDSQLCHMLQHLVSTMCSTHPLLSPSTISIRHAAAAAPSSPHPHLAAPLPKLSSPAPYLTSGQLPLSVVHSSSLFHSTAPPLPYGAVDTDMASPPSSPSCSSSRSSFESDTVRVPDAPLAPSLAAPPSNARLSAAKIRLHHLIDLEVPTLSSHRHARSAPTPAASSTSSSASDFSSHSHAFLATGPPSFTSAPPSSASQQSSHTSSQFSFPTHSDFFSNSSSASSNASFNASFPPSDTASPQPRLRTRTPRSTPNTVDLLAAADDAQVPSCTLLTDRLRAEEDGWGGLGCMEGMMYAGPPSGLHAASFSLLDCNTIFESPLVQALMHDHEQHVSYL